MKYYLLSAANDKKETGVLGSQCMAFPSGYNLKWYDGPNSMSKSNNNSFPSDNTEFIFELIREAKVTDIINQSIISAKGFLINNRVKNILGEFNLPDHKYFPATVISKGDKLNYYWLHFIDNNYNEIDYSTSIFYEGNAAGWKKKDYQLDSFKTLFDLQNNDIIPIIWAERLCFKKSLLDNKFDILLYSLLHNNVFASEKLASDFRKNKITGYKLKEQQVLI